MIFYDRRKVQESRDLECSDVTYQEEKEDFWKGSDEKQENIPRYIE
jgi:hypothetical protein